MSQQRSSKRLSKATWLLHRSFVLASIVAILSGACCFAAEQDTFERPNQAEECGSAPIDFLAYAQALGSTVCGPDECEFQEKAATLFDMKYRQDYKVIEYESSSSDDFFTYILYQCGAEKPNDEFIQELISEDTSVLHFLEIPLTAVATEDSTVGWMLEELGVLDRVRYAANFSTSPCMQKIAAGADIEGCNRTFVGEFDSGVPTNISEFDVQFTFSGDVDTKKVIMQASADPGPLARAEHIVYLSAFFNVEQRAMAWFQQVLDSYTDKAEVVAVSDTAPVVAWVTAHVNGSESFKFSPDGEVLGEGPVVEVSFARYKTLFTRDAGGALPSQNTTVSIPFAFADGDNIIFAASEFPSEAALFEAVGSVLEGVSVVIDESFSPAEVSDFIGLLGLSGPDVVPTAYPFLANENIWRHDKARTVDGNDDWFGEGVARPDLVHSDLKEIITPGSVPNHTFRFFRNFSKGEATNTVGLEACTEITCDSYAQQEPLMVDTTAAASVDGTAASVAPADPQDELRVLREESGAGQALATGAITAGAIIAALL